MSKLIFESDLLLYGLGRHPFNTESGAKVPQVDRLVKISMSYFYARQRLKVAGRQ